MRISRNNLYKQHHTDYLQKPVTYSKSLVNLSKVSLYVNKHKSVPSEWKVLVSLFRNKIVKMFIHVVNNTEMQKAALLMYAIYPFKK